jgi:putative ABC transport system permease protein
VVRDLLLENALLTALGLALGLVLTLILHRISVRIEPGLAFEAGSVAWGATLLFAAGQVATLAPAIRASRVPPSVATRAV